ncbi:hypothetical protein [Enterococcus sp. AZ163]|uniref:hypothetical protein n=1 Tax=Enterococcus sp. AZ163 TaxID=2774638 RepID=UPI003D2E79F5
MKLILIICVAVAISCAVASNKNSSKNSLMLYFFSLSVLSVVNIFAICVIQDSILTFRDEINSFLIY